MTRQSPRSARDAVSASRLDMNTRQRLRAAIYTRVSSDEQTKGYGLEYQLEDCKRAVARDGHQLVEVYSDPGISGTREDRPGLNHLRGDARLRRFDVLYVWKSDRLARDEIILLTLDRELRALGIMTNSVTEPQMNDFTRGIYAVFGAEDLRNIKAKMYSGRLRALRDGKWIGVPPFGYKKDRHFRLRPHKREADVVRQLFEWFVEDGISLQGLTKRARTAALPTRFDTRKRAKPRNGSGMWTRGGVGRLIRREYYATGVARYQAKLQIAAEPMSTRLPRAEIIEVHVPAIVPRDLFKRAQEQLQRNRDLAPRRRRRRYLFVRKLRCGFCKRRLVGCFRMRGRPRRPLRYYGFTGWAQPRCPHCCYYPEHLLERPIWEAITSLFADPKAFLAAVERYRRRGTAPVNIAAEEQTLADSEARLSVAERALLQHELDGFYSLEVIQEKRQQLVAQRSEVAERRVRLTRIRDADGDRHSVVTSVEKMCRSLEAKVNRASYTTKQEIIQRIIEEVILYGNRAEVRLVVPSDIVTTGATSVGSNTGAAPRHMRRTPLIECVANDHRRRGHLCSERSQQLGFEVALPQRQRRRALPSTHA